MARVDYFLTNRHLQDINPLILGEERCDPCHSFGPAVRKYTLLHYVVSGKGTLYSRGQAFPVCAGQAFLILPGEVTTYTADASDPWHYRWIGFNGTLSEDFSRLPAVFPLPEDVLQKMLLAAQDSAGAEYRVSAELMQLYARLFTEKGDGNRHVRKVENYIRSFYMHPIRVEEIAQNLCLDRRYLSRLFKEKTGYSIQDYLITTRLREAERLLRQGCSVQEAAFLSGYEDVSNFSKRFKREFGISPKTIQNSEK